MEICGQVSQEKDNQQVLPKETKLNNMENQIFYEIQHHDTNVNTKWKKQWRINKNHDRKVEDITKTGKKSR